MGKFTLIYVCICVCAICAIILILMAKTNFLYNWYIRSKNKYVYDERLNTIYGWLITWFALSLGSFLLSPVIAYAIYVIIAALNMFFVVLVFIIDGDSLNLPDIWMPKWGIINTWLGFWVCLTIYLFVEFTIEYKKINERLRRQKEKKEEMSRKLAILRARQTTQTSDDTPPPQPPDPKPTLPQITLPRAPNASVRKYYCLDDGITAKTWLTMSEAKYYVSTLSFKKVLQLDGKHIVCRIYTKGSWVSHSMTQINCDDNGKLTFGRTTRL